MFRKFPDIESEKKKLTYEYQLLAEGKRYIAGVDEVGRGPLAGPVVCAAVIMPLGDNDLILGVDDSKKVTEKNRRILSEAIKNKAIAYSICAVNEEVIDEINILNATKRCMKNAIEGLSLKPDCVLIDAVDLDIDVETRPIIKGDAKSYVIGAASIIAKVYRDALMDEYDERYPEYGFKKNKGYGTKEHINAIRTVGPCPIHRKTFIKNFWEV